ncbi:longitudinals lacking protein, isoforms H/M/V-like [Pectinophora gossypiella]|uniref:longitudinals lacking protein, isoforms H/M/V-like n=1 Tax=Pectinophora gossypiella TaxID=13191 RepID=UPI00214DF349|nr:longitudinals lacking protein, isoforms H/M/V-like [Pectinophora gossypiella]XP_049885306.1 longitudinals lacking protein, isoforms H/M/V-like [Pectinophora gossypiella]XP_049885307.1 longitudinals lacking protein, isoforms H/M/V-like [Pectinophora gossypiella]XP_049885308.1 longitudinals lacking protein, isoforms H/M/V-like [Pectinophora gossypiella]XP_049885309.1 longitudinals lacking protein, isoforms H/M/V-like [Pectinophora gossypiella]
MSQQYSLRWNNHQPNFISMFTTLLNTQTLVDVTLAAEGKHLQAHKVVLSACSTYFQALFMDNPSRHPIVILKDVTFADLRTMVDFMYYGEVNVTEEQLPQVLDTAKTLKIKGLTEMPDSTLLTRSQGTSADFPTDSADSQRHAASPSISPRRKRGRRRSSAGSGQMVEEEGREESGPSVDVVRGEAITLSSVPQRRSREYHDDRAVDGSQQTAEGQNLNLEQLGMEGGGMAQGGQWSMMEHTYPRYSNACLGSSLQGEAMYMNNMSQHMNAGLSEYGQALGVGGVGGVGGVAGPSPGPSCVADAAAAPEQPPQQQQKRRRATNPQSEENFQRALEAVRFGGIGFCKAARLFGVNNRTLWLEYKKKGYPNNRPSIKSRIKRERTTPPPPRDLVKDDVPQQEQQMALICPPHPVPVNYIDSRPVDFPLQGMAHNSPLNILGVNFTSTSMQ